MSNKPNSKPKSKQKIALLGLLAIVAISTGIISIGAFNEPTTSLTGTDTAILQENTDVVGHYSLVANDKAQIGDEKPIKLESQSVEIHALSFDATNYNPDTLPIQYHGDEADWGGVGLIEHYSCPSGTTINTDDTTTCVDSEGNVLERELKYAEKIHNRVVDQGEQFLLAQVFQDSTVPEAVDTDQFGSICVTIEVAFVDTSEAETANGFDTGNTTTETNCIEDTAVVITSGVATIGPLTFDAPTHVGASDTITGFGICQATTTPYADCEEGQATSSGLIFSVIDTADRTLETSETVDITYTFDISSAGA